MKNQFNLINKSNQSIKFSIYNSNKITSSKKYESYKYNTKEIFKYNISFEKSEIKLSIYISSSVSYNFYNRVIGSFVFTLASKYLATDIKFENFEEKLLDEIILGFRQKDFIFSKYKKNSKNIKYKSNFNLTKKIPPS